MHPWLRHRGHRAAAEEVAGAVKEAAPVREGNRRSTCACPLPSPISGTWAAWPEFTAPFCVAAAAPMAVPFCAVALFFTVDVEAPSWTAP